MRELEIWRKQKMDKLRRDVDRLFDALCADFGLPSVSRAGGRLRLVDEGDRLVAESRLPGLSVDDLDLHVSERRLALRGVARESRPGGRRVRRFHEEISLPCRVDPAGATARYENGVLRVVLPKAEDGKERRVCIECDR